MTTLRELANERLNQVLEQENNLVKALFAQLEYEGFSLEDNRAVFTVPELGIGYLVEYLPKISTVKCQAKWTSNLDIFDMLNENVYTDYFFTKLSTESITKILDATIRNVTDMISKAPFTDVNEAIYGLPFSANH